MSKIETLQTITAGNGGTTVLNNNMDKITTAFNNTLSLDGSTPNTIQTNLDFNSNKGINLATPTSNTDASTKKYVDDQTAAAIQSGVDAAAAADESEASAAASVVSETNAAASAVEAAASADSIRVITSDTTVTVGTGGDYASLDLAMTAIAPWVIDYKSTLTISILAGEYTHSAVQDIEHAYGSRINIKGATPEELTFDSLVSITSNGIKDHDVVFQFSDIGSVVVGDYIRVRNLTGTGHSKVLQGSWKVTAIDSGTERITLKITARRATIDATTVTAGTFKKLGTVLVYNGCIGFLTRNTIGEGSSAQVGIGDLILVGDDTPTFSAILAEYGAVVNIVGEFGINNFGRYGLYAIYGATINALNVGVSNCTSNGIYALSGSKIQAVNSDLTGNGNIGAASTTGSFLAISGANCSGNLSAARATSHAGVTWVNGHAYGNSNLPIFAEYNSFMDATGVEGDSVNASGVKARYDSTIEFTNGTMTGATSYDLDSEQGSLIIATGATYTTLQPALNTYDNGGAIITDGTLDFAIKCTTLTATGAGSFNGTVVDDDSLAFSQSEIRDYVGNIEYDALSINRNHLFKGGDSLKITLDMTDGDILFEESSNGIYNGAGSPEGVKTASPGSIYLSTNGNVYKKSSGTGSSNWVSL